MENCPFDDVFPIENRNIPLHVSFPEGENRNMPRLHQLEVFEILLPPTRMPRLGDLKVNGKKMVGKVDEEREKASFSILESLESVTFLVFLGRVVCFW